MKKYSTLNDLLVVVVVGVVVAIYILLDINQLLKNILNLLVVVGARKN
jgi:hypothetical protein